MDRTGTVFSVASQTQGKGAVGWPGCPGGQDLAGGVGVEGGGIGGGAGPANHSIIMPWDLAPAPPDTHRGARALAVGRRRRQRPHAPATPQPRPAAFSRAGTNSSIMSHRKKVLLKVIILGDSGYEASRGRAGGRGPDLRVVSAASLLYTSAPGPTHRARAVPHPTRAPAPRVCARAHTAPGPTLALSPLYSSRPAASARPR